MTRISFNKSLIDSKVIPHIDTAIAKLNKALTIAKNSTVPSGFKYSAYLNDFEREIKNRIDKLDNIKTTINKCNKMYDEITTDNNNETMMISDIKISKRDGAII